MKRKLYKLMSPLLLAGTLLSTTQGISQHSQQRTAWREGTTIITLSSTNDQFITTAFLPEGTPSKDKEGNTVSFDGSIEKFTKNKKYMFSFQSNLYQQALSNIKLNHIYRAGSITKTECKIGIQTKPNTYDLSHHINIHFTSMQSGKSILTEIRKWYHTIWGASKYETLLNEYNLHAIGASYGMSHHKEGNINSALEYSTQTRAGIEAFIGNIHSNNTSSVVEDMPSNIGFKYLSNLNASFKGIITYYTKHKKEADMYLETNILYKKYLSIEFKDLIISTDQLLKEQGKFVQHHLELQTPQNSDIIYSLSLNKHVFNTHTTSTYLSIGWIRELSRENILFSTSYPQDLWSVGFKVQF